MTILDDRIAEFQESFQLHLTSITGKSSLGSRRQFTVTIETSDNPHGLVGVYNSSRSISVENPVNASLVSFPLTRVDGTNGKIEVILWSFVILFFCFRHMMSV